MTESTLAKMQAIETEAKQIILSYQDEIEQSQIAFQEKLEAESLAFDKETQSLLADLKERNARREAELQAELKANIETNRLQLEAALSQQKDALINSIVESVVNEFGNR